MQSFDFYYDFASPNAYVVHKLLLGICARTGATAQYRPVYLGGVFKATGNQSPALAGVSGKMDYLHREMERFINRHDLPFVWTPHFPLHSVALMRAALAADGKPWQAAFIDAMFKACWVSGENMSEAAVIGRVLESEGLPVAEIFEAAQDAQVKAGLFAATEAAVARGVFGVPTMFVGEEMFFGKDSLLEFEAELLRAG